MFNNLTQRLSLIVKTLRGKTRLTEENTKEILREVRMAFLEADVALPVVQDFILRIKNKALGIEVIESLNPCQTLIGFVHQELTTLMGSNFGEYSNELCLATQSPAVILMAGLQGTGKTTTAAKIAYWLTHGYHKRYGRKTGKKKVLTASADIYRPAAIEQLNEIAKKLGIDFFSDNSCKKPEDIARGALNYASYHCYDVLIFDTAGRLGINNFMMNEIRLLHNLLKPIETLFIVDAMQGQDSINVAKQFIKYIPLTGIVLTKVDGDTRGGAALSVCHIINKPLKFIGTSEKFDGLEVFYPDRMARRILGMGDVISLVEQAQSSIDNTTAKNLKEKIESGNVFDLNDFQHQLESIKKFGGLNSLIEKLPMQLQQKNKKFQYNNLTKKQLSRIEGILNSMTPCERTTPELIKAKRKRRIAFGSGVSIQEVNRLLVQFTEMKKMVKQMKTGGMKNIMRTISSFIK